MATASPFDAALRDVIERLYVAATQLPGEPSQARVAEQAVELARRLTRSSKSVIALRGLSAGQDGTWSASADPAASLEPEAIGELLSAAGFPKEAVPGVRRFRSAGGLSAIGAELGVSGRVIGVLAVGRSTGYDRTEGQLLATFAAIVAQALDAAELKQRQQALDTELRQLRERAEEREAEHSALTEEIAVVERVEQAEERAVEVLVAVSAHASSGENLNGFYRRLSHTVAQLVGASTVVFWRLTDDGMLVPELGYGLNESLKARLEPTRCELGGDDLASRVVFGDLIFRANRNDEPAEFADFLEVLGVSSAISVPWRAGSQRLGLLAAYNSTRRGGFLREDTWVLQKAGLAAGLVTQLWHTQEELRKSVERLTKVDAARQLLLKNMTTVVDKERRRFVTELHDDALQKLTAAEIQAARLVPGIPVDGEVQEALTKLLSGTDSALRRLVFEVHPPSLDAPDGLVRSIQERVAMLTASGMKAYAELDVPENLSHDTKALIFREVAEAIGNVERHSKATEVKISLGPVEGGLLGVIHDNGEGFVVAERSNLPGHLGLQALKERALMAGGRYKIESQPGAGARIEFWIPLDL